jgi:hypothetical protein
MDDSIEVGWPFDPILIQEAVRERPRAPKKKPSSKMTFWRRGVQPEV